MSDNEEPTEVQSSLSKALGQMDFDFREVQEALNGAYRAVEGREHEVERRFEFAFRSERHDLRFSKVDPYNMMSGDWMQCQCALTGMAVALPNGSPVPQILVWESTERGENLAEAIMIHPDFLSDRGQFHQVLVSYFKTEVSTNLYRTCKAFAALQFLGEEGQLPGTPTEGVSYPRGQGYEALGNSRPVPQEDDEDDD